MQRTNSQTLFCLLGLHSLCMARWVGEGVEDFFLDGVSNFFEGKRGDLKNFLRQEEDANFFRCYRLKKIKCL